MPRFTQTARRGLTLIELVVVIAILAVLAAMIIPRLDFLKTQAEHAAGAATTADLASLIQTYRASSGSYPTFDSLVDSSGALITATGGTAAIWATGATLPLTPSTITAANPGVDRWYGSFLEGGLKYAYLHTVSSNVSNSVTSANLSAPVDLVNLTGGSTGATLATLNGTGTYAATIPTTCFPELTAGLTGTAAVTALETAGIKLVAMGVGPTTKLGAVMNQIPLEASGGEDAAKIYCRYYAIFAIYKDGRAANLRMVVDHRFKQVGKKVEQYNSSGATAGG